MVFPEHMEFRYYITPERKECFALYDKTHTIRMLTQRLSFHSPTILKPSSVMQRR